MGHNRVQTGEVLSNVFLDVFSQIRVSGDQVQTEHSVVFQRVLHVQKGSRSEESSRWALQSRVLTARHVHEDHVVFLVWKLGIFGRNYEDEAELNMEVSVF